MNRRQLLVSAVGVVAGALIPAIAVGAVKKETLPEYLLRITPTTDDQWWQVTMRCLRTGERQTLEYKRSDLWVGNEGGWVNKYYLETAEGPMKIDPTTLELVPFTPTLQTTLPFPPSA